MRRFLSLLFIFAAFFHISCANGLQGTVFLDENGNNVHDENEDYLSNVTFQVTLDDEILDVLATEAITDANGEYSVDVTKSGTYCVIVDEGDLNGTDVTLVAPQNLTIDPESYTTSSESLALVEADENPEFKDNILFLDATETSCVDEVDNDEDGDLDCNDSDCTADSNCTEDEEDPTEASDEEESETAVTESGTACDDFGGLLTLDVPIAKNYATGVESLEDPDERTVSRGDTIELDIIYPSSCTFDLIYLPTSVMPTGVPNSSYDETTGQFNINMAIENTTVTTSTPISVHHDSLSTYTPTLSIVQDGSLSDKTVTISPTVSCPDGETVNLQSHTLNIDSDGDFTITQTMTGNPIIGATDITITTVVTNNSSVSYTASEIELDITLPNFTTGWSYTPSSGTCNNLGQSASCTFAISGGNSVTVTSVFDMPTSEPDNDTTFTSEADLTVTSDGVEAIFEGPDVVFSIQGAGS